MSLKWHGFDIPGWILDKAQRNAFSGQYVYYSNVAPLNIATESSTKCPLHKYPAPESPPNTYGQRLNRRLLPNLLKVEVHDHVKPEKQSQGWRSHRHSETPLLPRRQVHSAAVEVNDSLQRCCQQSQSQAPPQSSSKSLIATLL